MKKLLIILMLLVLLALSACVTQLQSLNGSGKLATQEQQLSGINGVTLAAPGELTIQRGEEESLQVEMEDNLLPYFEAREKDGMLTIGFDAGVEITPTQPIRYLLTVQSLDTIINASLGSIRAPALEAKNFTVKVNSIGDVDLDGLRADRLAVDQTSQGNLDIGAGQVTEQWIAMSGEGAYQAPDLLSVKADVTINSSGDATIWVTGELHAMLTSVGKLYYYGDPKITTSLTSAGKVNSLGDK